MPFILLVINVSEGREEMVRYNLWDVPTPPESGRQDVNEQYTTAAPTAGISAINVRHWEESSEERRNRTGTGYRSQLH